MKIVNVKMSGKDKFYLVEVDYIKGMNAYYSTGYYASGYYAICMPITLKEGTSDEVEELTYESIAEIYEEYEEMTLLMKTGDCSEEEEKKAKELLSDEVIKSLVYKIEMNIREEKEMEKMMKENGFGFYGNMNGMNRRDGFVNKDDSKGDITKCKYYVKLNENNKVTFDDIAGMVEVKREILEAVDIFKDGEKYKEIGVTKRMNNILLSGSPGVGKTLMVKAIANYLDVPLFQASGDFVDRYVGTGSSNVETFFRDARKHAPCVCFIDEAEQVAKKRSYDSNNNEREGATAKLLAELDGFETTDDVLFIMATNNPDALDEAVLSRMSKKIHITNPDYATRLGILEITTKKMKLEDNCDLDKIAKNLAGFNGRTISAIMNQAGILAVRKGLEKITQTELEEAMEKEVCGVKSETKKLIEKEKETVAYHELGHAILSYLKKSEKIQRISIVPTTSDVLGYCFYLNEDDNDRFLKTKNEILGDIMTSLAGRAAEELKFKIPTGGCSNDLEKATHLAETMICKLGMSDNFGLMSINPNDTFMRQRVLDEVNNILNDCYKETMRILKENEYLLDELAKVLIEKEVMDLKDFEEVLHRVEK